jgi:hypothetical protein
MLWRPIELWVVEAPIFSLDSRLTDGGKVVSLYQLPYGVKTLHPCNRPWRPIELWDVEAPIFSLDSRLTDGGKVVSRYQLPYGVKTLHVANKYYI